MPLSTPRPIGWSRANIALHWISFLLVLGLALLGLWMTTLPPSLDKIQWYALHKSLGLTVLALTLLRLAWLAFGARPAAIPAPRWARALARLVHALLYLLLLAVPLSGWWFNSTTGFALRWFGVLPVPALGGADAALRPLAKAVHEWLFYLLAALVLVHALAALWHHYKLRDDTLSRMLRWSDPKDRR